MRYLIVTEMGEQPQWLLERLAPLIRKTRAEVELAVVSLGRNDDTKAYLTFLNRLLEFSGRKAGANLSKRLHLLPSAPREKLTRLSSQYDLIVLASPTDSKRHLLQRSTTLRIMQHTKCALWIPQPSTKGVESQTERSHAGRCLVGINIGGPRSREVLRMAADWTYLLGGQLDAFYAWSRGRGVEEEPPGARQQLELLMLETVLPEVRGATHIREGQPELIASKMSEDYALVIVGNRDQSGLKGFLEGPIISQIERDVHCDVLTLPTRQLG